MKLIGMKAAGVTRYEYKPLVVQYSPERVSAASDEGTVLHKLGWRRVWADITPDSIFLVYRRETK